MFLDTHEDRKDILTLLILKLYNIYAAIAKHSDYLVTVKFIKHGEIKLECDRLYHGCQ